MKEARDLAKNNLSYQERMLKRTGTLLGVQGTTLEQGEKQGEAQRYQEAITACKVELAEKEESLKQAEQSLATYYADRPWIQDFDVVMQKTGLSKLQSKRKGSKGKLGEALLGKGVTVFLDKRADFVGPNGVMRLHGVVLGKSEYAAKLETLLDWWHERHHLWTHQALTKDEIATCRDLKEATQVLIAFA